MTQTEHYQLPHWEKTDPVRMSDFNGVMEKLDGTFPYAFLRKAVLEEPAAQLDLDVSDIALTDYCKLEIFVRIPSGSGGCRMQVNNSPSYRIHEAGSNAGSSGSENITDNFVWVPEAPSGHPSYSIHLHQPNPGGKAACTTFCAFVHGITWSFNANTAISTSITWEQVRTFNLLPVSGTLPAGTSLTLCGVKFF